MDIHHLRIFTAVYRNRSFTRAAAELRISQPTVSEHMRKLEGELACQLFDRLGRTIVPTDKADLLYPKACRIVDDVLSLPSEIDDEDAMMRGEIVFGASTIPGTYLMPELISRFRADHPLVSFRVVVEDTAQITARVAEHKLLCGIVGAPSVATDELLCEPFYSDELVFVAAPGFWAGSEMRPEELAAQQFVLREEGSGTRQAMESFLKKIGVRLSVENTAAIFGASAAIKEAAKCGLGLAVLSRIAIREELASGTLRELRVNGAPMRRSFYLLRHKKRTLPAIYRRFCEFLKKEMHAF